MMGNGHAGLGKPPKPVVKFLISISLSVSLCLSLSLSLSYTYTHTCTEKPIHTNEQTHLILSLICIQPHVHKDPFKTSLPYSLPHSLTR